MGKFRKALLCMVGRLSQSVALCAALIFLAARADAQVAPQIPPHTKTISTFRDCADCPQMVVVSYGTFVMGVPAQEDRKYTASPFLGWGAPQHSVTIKHNFA